MGLTITAYCGLDEIETPRFDSNGDPLDTFAVRFYGAPRFPDHADGIDTGLIYRYTNSYEFYAGSYAIFHIWREQLAKLAGYPAITLPGRRGVWHENGAIDAGAGPFYELIHFSATMGTIGPRLSRKLADDFSRFMHAVDAAEDGTFALLYRNWFQAFMLARLSGAVQFH
ncbi:hypothetical protein [Burkholderia stagnalis]|uniref:hypothetical protein n=1 Tax=Burkholderia stagnalis TaxID=1503054 RepID=UPI00075B956B|nr:hypothetical protein [Burkholderia stagnalis]KVM89663.1 hypothetical protein WT05_04070 [Burkholderia stagnalis]